MLVKREMFYRIVVNRKFGRASMVSFSFVDCILRVDRVFVVGLGTVCESLVWWKHLCWQKISLSLASILFCIDLPLTNTLYVFRWLLALCTSVPLSIIVEWIWNEINFFCNFSSRFCQSFVDESFPFFGYFHRERATPDCLSAAQRLILFIEFNQCWHFGK